MSKVIGEKNCLMCGREYSAHNVREVLVGPAGEIAYVDAKCFDRVEFLAAEGGVSRWDALQCSLEKLKLWLLGPDKVGR